jgi:imidazolonepropionase-like amidohydrolase
MPLRFPSARHLSLVVVTTLVGVVPFPLGARQVVAGVDGSPFILRGGLLWDGTGDAARPNSGIYVANGTILGVDLEASELPAEVEVLDLPSDAFVVPGLFDLHAHYAVDLFGEGRVDEYAVNPVLFLANGVTSTFPAGEVDPEEARLGRERIANGEIPGPRIFSSGPYWGSARPGWRHDAMTPDSIRAEAEYWALHGARGFKAKGIRRDQLRVVIDVAHEHGMTVTGHLDSGFRGSVNPADAIRMGIDRIEHFLGGESTPPDRSAYASIEVLDMDAPETAAKVYRQARLFLAHDTYFDATLSAYGYWADREPAVFDDWADEMGFLTAYARSAVEARLPREPLHQFERIYYVKRRTVKAFYDAGGGDHLTLGTDHPSWGEFWSGFGSHRELHAMVLAGIPNAAALRAGTINAARALGVSERLGTVEPGKYADLLIVRGNPLEDIRATRNGYRVVKAGRVYDPVKLFASVRGKMGPSSAAEAGWWKGNTRLGR